MVIGEVFSADVKTTSLRVAYNVMGATPHSAVSVGPRQGTSGLYVTIHVWRGVDASKPIDVTPATTSHVNSSQPNPPALTPVTAGAVILAAGDSAASGNGFGAFTSSDLSNFVSGYVHALDDAASGMGSCAWASGEFDPVTFGGGNVHSCFLEHCDLRATPGLAEILGVS